MTIPSVGNLAYPTVEEMQAQILSDMRYEYALKGIEINVSRGTEPWMRAKAFAQRASIVVANNQIELSNASPLSATGDDLEELALVYGVTRRPAAKGGGNVVVLTRHGVTVTIPKGFVCTAPDGSQYQTTQSVTVTTSGTVEVESVTDGADVNQDAGTICTWDSAAIGSLANTCTVGTGGISDGVDEDDDETLRSRLTRRLGFPAVGGNWAQVADWAESSSATIQLASVYPAVRGPGSYDVAICGATGTRVLNASVINTAMANILSNMPGIVDLNGTSVLNDEVNIVVDAELPLPINAGGAGGGWRDSVPWPSTAEDGVNHLYPYTEVTSIAAITSAQINVASSTNDPPVVGKRFAVWNPTGGDDSLGAMHEFTILTVAGPLVGAAAPVPAYEYTIGFDITQSDSFDFIEVGMLVSAGAENIKAYATALRDAISLLGPGEKTTNVDILPRGGRKPTVDVLWPNSLTSKTLSAITIQHNEVANLEYGARFRDGTGYAVGTYVALASPTVPADTTLPPRIITLNSLSFRRLV